MAKRKRAAKKKQPSEDELLDEVLGMSASRAEELAAKDDEPPKDEEETQVEEDTPLPDQGEAEGVDPPGEDETQDLDESATPSADPDESDESDDDPDGGEDAQDPATEDEEPLAADATEHETDPEKRAEGLLAALDKARKKNEALQAQLNLQQPVSPPVSPVQGPVPPPPGETTAPAQPLPQEPRIPVIVDPETQEVFVDPAVARQLLSGIANETVQQAMTPTPEQVAYQQAMQAAQKLREDYPEAASRVEMADNYLTEELRGLMAQGHRPRSVSEITALFKRQGIADELSRVMPEIEPMFDEFVEAVSSNQPAWKRSIVERLSNGTVPSRPKVPNTPVVKPSLSPTSLAKKGGSRTPGHEDTSDMKEFLALEAEFNELTVLQEPARYDRMKELGSALGIEGY